MIKVCHMTSVHGPEDGRIFHKECVSLAKAGYDVYLVERSGSYEKSGVHIVGIGEVPANRLKRMTESVQKVYKEAKALDADIYHIHDPELLPCGLKLKKAGKKVIFDSHEKYIEQIAVKPYLPRPAAAMISKIYGTYETFVLRQLDAVIFPCTIQGKNPFEGKCRRAILLNNVPLPEELFTEETVEKPDFKAGYAGGIRPDRGSRQNVMACEQANVPLVLAGEPSSQEFRKELETLDPKHLVTFLGKVDRPGVWKMLAGISVGLVTELNVGQNHILGNLPTKAYEYMAAGIPFLISRYPYAEEVVNRYHCGICVDPENVEEAVKALSFLRSHPEEARQMGENGRRAVREEFNWGVEEQKLLALYEDILKN